MYLVIGLGFGDEGKGSIIDALAQRSKAPVTVVRFNGGPQAAHHVVNDSGQSHCFSQFGSGMLKEPTRTLLSRHMLIEPAALLREAAALIALGVREPLRRLTIDARCVVVTPFHKLLNRMQEVARGAGRHGSCGLGVGQAWLDSRNPSLPSLRFGEVKDPAGLRDKLRFLQLVKLDLAEQLAEAHGNPPQLCTYVAELSRPDLVASLVEVYQKLADGIAGSEDDHDALLSQAVKKEDGQEQLLFEGAQGVLLDAEYGFFPYVSPSHTTFRNALSLLSEADARRKPLRIGVLRAYFTRHGAGPFVTEDPALGERLPELHNRQNPWQGPMRVGWFDAVAARYAIEAAGGVDQVALTNLDRLSGCKTLRVCIGYRTAKDTESAAVLRQLPRPASFTAAERETRTLALAGYLPVYEDLPGFAQAADGSRLTAQAAAFVRFLESESGIGVPITICSVGPTAKDKLFR